jgi:hypothetical protein
VEPTAETGTPAEAAAPRRPEGEGADHAGAEAAEAARRRGVTLGLALAEVAPQRRSYSKVMARPVASLPGARDPVAA